MAHVIRVIKAAILKKKLLKYLKQKEIALNKDESSKRRKFKSKIPKSVHKYFNKIKTPNSVKNFICKSLLGFIGGILLTYIFFCFFYFGVNLSPKTTTYICGLAGTVLCLCLAFSSKVRCYALLLIPVFFSNEGRQAVLTYALFLSFTGPGKNSMHNLRILSDSLTCGQEMVKRTLKQLIGMVKAPYGSIKDILESTKKSLEKAVKNLKQYVVSLNRIVLSLLRVIKKATLWLRSVVNLCKKKIGTPFQRCVRTFEEATIGCKATLGEIDSPCHVVQVVKGLCRTVKFKDFICLYTDFVSDRVIRVVKSKLKEFNSKIKNLFYVSIEYSHSCELNKKASKKTKDLAKTIVDIINEKVEEIQSFFSFCGFVFSFFFIFVMFKVYYYKYKYLTSDRFDNVYISKYVLELDAKRAQMGKETVMPLEPKEKKLYGKPDAVRVLAVEKMRMAQSMFLLILTSFKIITFLAIDYGLFWTLMTIYEAGRVELKDVEKTRFVVHVEGNGLLADFFRNLGESLQVPENPNMRLTPLHCLPDPVEPDLGRYKQIGILVALCWSLTLTETYGLRLRHVVMSYYYPDRARERAVWLYNHILRSRGSFIRYTRRRLRRKFGKVCQSPVERNTLTQRLFNGFPLLGALFGKSSENNCLLCKAPETKTQLLKRCKTPDCPGRYCLKCFAKSENFCTVCQHPLEYGNISVSSEEVDSSEEDLYKKQDLKCRLESDEPIGGNEFQNFKEMEVRERFRDMEANSIPDYVRLGDLYQDKAALKEKLREVINRRIQNIEREKQKEERRRSELLRIKSKLQILACTLKRKKSNLHKAKKSELIKNFKEIVKNIKRDKEKKENDEKNFVRKKSKGKVTFKLEDEKQEVDYANLKRKVSKRIKILKEPKNLWFEELTSDSSE